MCVSILVYIDYIDYSMDYIDDLHTNLDYIDYNIEHIDHIYTRCRQKPLVLFCQETH